MAVPFFSDVEFKGLADFQNTVLADGDPGTSGQVFTSQGAGQHPIWAAAGSGSVTIGASAADVLSATAGEITADDAAADKLVFWDDSAGKLTYLAIGNGLVITGTEIATAADIDGGAAATVFTPSTFTIIDGGVA